MSNIRRYGSHSTDITTLLETYEANKSVTTMEGQALAKNNLMNNYDALRLMPGVSTAAFGGRDRFSAPTHIRGNGAWGTSETLDDYPAVQVVPVSAEDGGYTASFSTITSATRSPYEGLTVSTGVRGTRIDNSFDTNGRAAYDVGLAYRLPTRTRLKASYSTGYKLNKPFYLWWGGGNFIRREPSDGIRPSNTRTTEFGAEQAISVGGGMSGTLRASVFRTDEKDLFNFGNTGTGTPYYDQLRVDGFELWSQWRVGRVRPFVSYTWLDNVRSGTDNLNASNLDLRFAPLPGKSAGFGAFVPATRRFDFSIMGMYDNGGIQEALVNDQIVLTRYQEFLKINALLSISVTDKLSLLVRAENLLNRRDLGYSRSILQMNGSSEQVAGTQRDPGLILAGGVQWAF